MPLFRIPTPLRAYTNGQNEVSVSGKTVNEILDDLIQKYPEIETHIYDGVGSLRPFVNLYIGEENISQLQGLDTPVELNDRVMLLPSIAGG